MKTTQGFSDAMKMAEPGSWNVAQVCCHHDREFSYMHENGIIDLPGERP
jgi:hypothetical protein